MLENSKKDADSAVTSESPSKSKSVLAVKDGPDVLGTVAKKLDVCTVVKAQDYNSAIQQLANNANDIVLLDAMGVKFDLLRNAMDRGYPTVMLISESLTQEGLKKSFKLGAVTCAQSGIFVCQNAR